MLACVQQFEIQYCLLSWWEFLFRLVCPFHDLELSTYEKNEPLMRCSLCIFTLGKGGKWWLWWLLPNYMVALLVSHWSNGWTTISYWLIVPASVQFFVCHFFTLTAGKMANAIAINFCQKFLMKSISRPSPFKELKTKEIECSLNEMVGVLQRPVVPERSQIYQYVALILCQPLDAGGIGGCWVYGRGSCFL